MRLHQFLHSREAMVRVRGWKWTANTTWRLLYKNNFKRPWILHSISDIWLVKNVRPGPLTRRVTPSSNPFPIHQKLMIHLPYNELPLYCSHFVPISPTMDTFMLRGEGGAWRLENIGNNNSESYSAAYNLSHWCPFSVSQMGSDGGEQQYYASAEIFSWIH